MEEDIDLVLMPIVNETIEKQSKEIKINLIADLMQ